MSWWFTTCHNARGLLHEAFRPLQVTGREFPAPLRIAQILHSTRCWQRQLLSLVTGWQGRRCPCSQHSVGRRSSASMLQPCAMSFGMGPRFRARVFREQVARFHQYDSRDRGGFARYGAAARRKMSAYGCATEPSGAGAVDATASPAGGVPHLHLSRSSCPPAPRCSKSPNAAFFLWADVGPSNGLSAFEESFRKTGSLPLRPAD
jgi:hypothetical protein